MEENPNITAPYELFPAWPVAEGTIGAGFDALASKIRHCRRVTIDGYVGVDWEQFRHQLNGSLDRLGVVATWIAASTARKTEAEIDELITPFLGGNDPLFGTRFTGTLSDLFQVDRLISLTADSQADCTILYGTGAALAAWDSFLVYVDLSKHELQLRSRRGEVCNLGADQPIPPKPQYKRFYFVDWPVLNQHKRELFFRVDLFVDEQLSTRPTLISGGDLRSALSELSRNVFRVRPWFEPGPWGGQWIKQRAPALPQYVDNYAWSFELITPENGLLFDDGNHQLEVSFDWLMYGHSAEVLGASAGRFGCEFPIRFDFLDTVAGGNLSLQCHPQSEYIRKHFGESFTQDETYYILDAKPNAKVFLGFVEGVDQKLFERELAASARTGTEFDVERFVQSLPAHKHDLFLIPNGTIHCSGAGNLVLEISATPYIFTFKMYDWMRMGLDGLPRPLNIERALENLVFDRRGAEVADTLVSHPHLATEGDDWQLIHLPTHPEHFYDVHRYEFDSSVSGRTDRSPLVMMLVEGSSITVETGQRRQTFHYAETFVVPAAADNYRLTNLGDQRAKVVVASIKPHVE